MVITDSIRLVILVHVFQFLTGAQQAGSNALLRFVQNNNDVQCLKCRAVSLVRAALEVNAICDFALPGMKRLKFFFVRFEANVDLQKNIIQT